MVHRCVSGDGDLIDGLSGKSDAGAHFGNHIVEAANNQRLELPKTTIAGVADTRNYIVAKRYLRICAGRGSKLFSADKVEQRADDRCCAHIERCPAEPTDRVCGIEGDTRFEVIGRILDSVCEDFLAEEAGVGRNFDGHIGANCGLAGKANPPRQFVGREALALDSIRLRRTHRNGNATAPASALPTARGLDDDIGAPGCFEHGCSRKHVDVRLFGQKSNLERSMICHVFPVLSEARLANGDSSAPRRMCQTTRGASAGCASKL